jgi:hypothetical protein
LLTVLLIPSALASSLATRSELVLDFLMVGDIKGWPNHLGDDEPAIDVTLVPARAFDTDLPDEYIYRQSRIYTPRNDDRMQEYDVLFFNHPRLDFFTPRQQEMMARFTSVRGKASIAYPLSNRAEVQDPWLNSPISQVFPIDYEKFVIASRAGVVDQWWENRPFRLAPDLPPVFSIFESTGIFDLRIYRTSRPCYAKPGATIWLYMVEGPYGTPEEPAFISWPQGDSETWSFGIHPAEDRIHWKEVGPWWEIIFHNVCTYTINGEILSFDEAVGKRSVKTKFSYFHDSASMFHSIIDFVSEFGANTIEAESVLAEGNQVKTRAEWDYLERRYAEAGDKMENAVKLVNEAMDEARRAKDTALFWIYISEWTATTAVALASGAILWWLMLKRGLYGEVTTTQLHSK